MTTSTLVINASKEALQEVKNLDQIFCFVTLYYFEKI